MLVPDTNVFRLNRKVLIRQMHPWYQGEGTNDSVPLPTVHMTSKSMNPAGSFIAELLGSDVSGSIRELTREDVPHPKSGRMQSIEAPLFFKGVRDGQKACRDMFCDLLCANLGQLLNVPTPPQVAVDHPALGLGLVSPYLNGENGIAVDTPDQLVNTADVPLVCTFEEWVMNTDDKSSHFWTVSTEAGKKLYIVDHGHTLHRANIFGGVDAVANHPKITRSVGKDHYQIDTVSEVQPGIDRVATVEDGVIRRTVDAALNELRALDADHEKLSAFLAEAEYHRAVAVTILQQRRGAIETIMQDKFSR